MSSDQIQKRILILEDEYFIAADCAQEVIRQGMQVIGPVTTLDEALQALVDDRPNGAIIDLKVQDDDLALTVIEALREQGIPFVVYTGYGGALLPKHLPEIITVEKPLSAQNVVVTLLECMSAKSENRRSLTHP